MGAPEYEGDERLWHPDGADVPWWFIAGWVGMVAGVLALVASVL